MKTDSIFKKFNRIAESFDSQRKNRIQCYDDFYGTSVSFLASMRKNFKTVLDLGAGTGILSEYLYDQFPDAKYTLMDVADLMLDEARLRFKNHKNFHYITDDYSVTLPSVKFDLIATALSFHCIERKEKGSLYQNVYRHLKPGGYFFLLDRFSSSSSLIEKHYTRWRSDYIAKNMNHGMDNDTYRAEKKLRRNSTLFETVSSLSETGFKTAECIYSFMQYSVILAIK